MSRFLYLKPFVALATIILFLPALQQGSTIHLNNTPEPQPVTTAAGATGLSLQTAFTLLDGQGQVLLERNDLPAHHVAHVNAHGAHGCIRRKTCTWWEGPIRLRHAQNVRGPRQRAKTVPRECAAQGFFAVVRAIEWHPEHVVRSSL